VDPLTLPDSVTTGTLTFHAETTAAQGGPTSLTVTGNAGGLSRNTPLGFVVAGAPGTLDLSFGSGGKVMTPFPAGGGVATGVTIQSDRKIAVCGAIFTSPGFQAAVLRYNPDGSPDTSFGAGGRASFGLGMGALAGAMALQPDGAFILAGRVQPQQASATSNFL